MTPGIRYTGGRRQVNMIANHGVAWKNVTGKSVTGCKEPDNNELSFTTKLTNQRNSQLINQLTNQTTSQVIN